MGGQNQPTFDLLRYVNSLTVTSTAEEINKALFYDFKQEAASYYKHLVASGAVDSRTGSAILGTAEQYQFVENDQPTLNWLRYKLVGYKIGNQLESTYGKQYWRKANVFDCDSCALANQLYSVLGWDKTPDTYPYSGETVNSFWITFRSAIPFYFPGTDSDEERRLAGIFKISKKFGNDYALERISRMEWMIANFNLYQNLATDQQLQKFATLTHTLGNFMRIPSGKAHVYNSNAHREAYSYNEIKGVVWPFEDYPDQMFAWLYGRDNKLLEQYSPNEEIRWAWRDWFDRNREAYCLDCYFDGNTVISLFTRDNVMVSHPRNLKQLNEYLMRVNALIELRGIRMLMKLNEALDNNVYLQQRISQLESTLHLAAEYVDSTVEEPQQTRQPEATLQNQPAEQHEDSTNKVPFFSNLKTKLNNRMDLFRQDPLAHVGKICGRAAIAIAVIAFLVSFVALCTSGFFAKQTTQMKTRGFSAGFTNSVSGAASPIYGRPVVLVLVSVLMLVAYVVVYIQFFKVSKINMRVGLITLTVITLLGTILPVAMILYFAHLDILMLLNKLSETSVQVKPYRFMYDLISAKPWIPGVYEFVAFVLVVLLLVFPCISKTTRHETFIFLRDFAIVYVAVPLLFLIVENIVPGFVGIVFLAIAALLIYMVTVVFGGGGGDNSLKDVPTDDLLKQTSNRMEELKRRRGIRD